MCSQMCDLSGHRALQATGRYMRKKQPQSQSGNVVDTKPLFISSVFLLVVLLLLLCIQVKTEPFPTALN